MSSARHSTGRTSSPVMRATSSKTKTAFGSVVASTRLPLTRNMGIDLEALRLFLGQDVHDARIDQPLAQPDVRDAELLAQHLRQLVAE